MCIRGLSTIGKRVVIQTNTVQNLFQIRHKEERNQKRKTDTQSHNLKEFPEIVSCDLWQLVKDQENERYADWWKGESVSFNYLESVPLGRKVAESVSQALGQGGEINPPSVHQPARPLNGSR